MKLLAAKQRKRKQRSYLVTAISDKEGFARSTCARQPLLLEQNNSADLGHARNSRRENARKKD
jgi:hypothetical protein